MSIDNSFPSIDINSPNELHNENPLLAAQQSNKKNNCNSSDINDLKDKTNGNEENDKNDNKVNTFDIPTDRIMTNGNENGIYKSYKEEPENTERIKILNTNQETAGALIEENPLPLVKIKSIVFPNIHENKKQSDDHLIANLQENNIGTLEIQLGPSSQSQDIAISQPHIEEEPEPELKLTKLIFMIINLSLGYFFFSYQLSVFNPVQQNISFDLGWDADKKTIYISVLAAIVPSGNLIGAFIMGKIASIIGRRKSMIIYDVLALLGLSIQMIANTYSLIVGRFLAGMGNGGFMVIVPLYIKEFTPAKYKGIGSAAFNISFQLGLVTSFALGLNISPIDKPDLVWWRIMFALPSIVLITNLICLLTVFNKDTPVFKLYQKDREGCIDSLKEIYLTEEGAIKAADQLEKDLHQKETEEVHDFKDLFTNRFKQQILLALILMSSFHVSILTIIINFSTLIFLRTLPPESASFFSLMLAICLLAGAICSIFIFGRISNKTILIVCFSVIVCCLFAFSICEYVNVTEPEKYILMFFCFNVGSTLFIIFKIHPELLPDIGVGFVSLLQQAIGITVIITFPTMLKSTLVLEWSIMFYTFINLLILIFVIVFYKETNGLTRIEVTDLYNS